VNAAGGVVIELCGLPGAGKSLIAHRMVRELRSAGFPASESNLTISPTAAPSARWRRKAVLAAREGVAAHARSTLMTQLSVCAAQRSHRDRIARPLNLLVARQIVRASKAIPGYHVTDQGVVQEWWSAALRADRDAVLDAMSRSLATSPLPTALIRLDAPVDVLCERLQTRSLSQSRVERQALEDVRSELREAEHLLDEVLERVSAVPKARRPRLINVRADAPSDAIIASVLRPTG
jgi:thymidylate kinase